MASEWSTEDLEDLIADAISDSLDADWNSRDGARAVLRELEKCGLEIRLTPARRDLADNPPVPA